MQKWAHSKGFTIVELLIVVVVIAILAAITIVAFNGVQNRAKVSALQSSASQASKKLASYAVVNSETLPPDLATVGISNTDSTTYTYIYDNTPSPSVYCVSAATGLLSYASSNKSTASMEGRCVNNKVLNPSFETNTASWVQAGTGVSTLTTTTSESYAGSSSMQVASSGTSASQGAFTSSRAPIQPNTVYTASVWIKGEAGKTLRIEMGDWNTTPILNGTRSSSATIAATGNWQRFTVTRTTSANAASVDVVVRNVLAVAHTFYLDAVMISEGPDLLTMLMVIPAAGHGQALLTRLPRSVP